jgi:hypothetical protein
MKNIFKITPLLLMALSCKAQSPIINIEDYDGEPIQDAYYKDINNLLDPFVGTYIYTNGSTSLKIVLQKRIMAYNGYKYEDLLVGEYQYIENGVEKVNTLNNINSNLTNSMSISANYIYTNGSYWCRDCSPNEKRVMGGLVEHSTINHAQLLIGRLSVGGQPAIKINVWWRTKSHKETDPLPLDASFPGGDYILIKQ